jgi:hypothetical protein
VTAGEIDGVTVKAGSSDEVLINSSGISITSGTNGTNYYKFDGTTRGMRYSTGGTVDLRGANGVVLISDAGSDAGWDGSAWFPLADDNDDLGKSGQRWRDLYVSRDVYVSTLAGLGTSRFVCHDNSGKLYDSAGTCDGSAPAPSPAEVATLRQEIAELRAQVAELLAAVQSR